MGRQNNNKVKILAPIKTTENIWRLFPILFSFHWAIRNSPIQFYFLHSHGVLYKSYRAERIWCKMYMLLDDKFVFFLRVKMKHSIEMIKCPTYQTNETAADILEPDPLRTVICKWSLNHDRYNPDIHILLFIFIFKSEMFFVVIKNWVQWMWMNEQTIVNIHTPCVTLSYGWLVRFSLTYI